MRNFLLAASLALAAVMPSIAIAATTLPAGVESAEVTFGVLQNGNQVPMTANGKTVMIQLSICQIGWNTGDTFYVYHKEGLPYIAVNKKVMDVMVTTANGDWSVAFQAMLNNKQVCAISPVTSSTSNNKNTM